MGILELSKSFNIKSIKSPCIYWILNCNNLNIYVGQTKNVEKRYKQHLYLFEQNKHFNKEMQGDFNQNNSFVMVPMIFDNSLVPQKSLREQELENMLWCINHEHRIYNHETEEQIISLLNFERKRRGKDVYLEMHEKRDDFYKKYTGADFFTFKALGCTRKDLMEMQMKINEERKEEQIAKITYEVTKEIEIEVKSFLEHLEKRVYEIVSSKCKKIL